jgi:hypothetical protein
MTKSQQKRQALKAKVSQALNEEVKDLPIQMRDILMDDLITAFESRFAVFNKVKPNVECTVMVGLEVPQ